MATNTFVEVDIPEAGSFADLTGVLHDLRSTQRFAEKLRDTLAGERPDYSLVEPMTIAILVRYSRPFSSGVRKKLGPEEIDTLPTELRAAHERFRQWRDKHIAHSINAFEENQLVVRYWEERFEDEGFTSVECNSTMVVGFSSQDIAKILALISHFIALLEPRRKAEKARLLEIVRALPKEKVLAMRKKKVELPNLADVGRRRGR